MISIYFRRELSFCYVTNLLDERNSNTKYCAQFRVVGKSWGNQDIDGGMVLVSTRARKVSFDGEHEGTSPRVRLRQDRTSHVLRVILQMQDVRQELTWSERCSSKISGGCATCVVEWVGGMGRGSYGKYSSRKLECRGDVCSSVRLFRDRSRNNCL